MAAKEFLGLGRPGHQLGIETEPIGVERVPESAAVRGLADAMQKLRLKVAGFEESPAGARVTDADAFGNHAEALASDLFVAAKHDNRPRAHVLLFADHTGNTFVPEISKSFGRMFEQTIFATGLRRGHGWRKIDQPFRVHGEAAHDFERSHGVLLGNSDVVVQARTDKTLTGDIFQFEQVVVKLLGVQFRGGRLGRRGRTGSW